MDDGNRLGFSRQRCSNRSHRGDADHLAELWPDFKMCGGVAFGSGGIRARRTDRVERSK
jgi:hypothetical protein